MVNQTFQSETVFAPEVACRGLEASQKRPFIQLHQRCVESTLALGCCRLSWQKDRRENVRENLGFQNKAPQLGTNSYNHHNIDLWRLNNSEGFTSDLREGTVYKLKSTFYLTALINFKHIILERSRHGEIYHVILKPSGKQLQPSRLELRSETLPVGLQVTLRTKQRCCKTDHGAFCSQRL